MRALKTVALFAILSLTAGCQSLKPKEHIVRIPQTFGRFPNAEMMMTGLQVMRIQIHRPILLQKYKKSSVYKKTFFKKGSLDDSNESFYVNDARCSIETHSEQGQLLNPEVVDAYMTEDYVLAFVHPNNEIEYGIRCYKEGPNSSLVTETPSATLLKATFQDVLEVIDGQNQ